MPEQRKLPRVFVVDDEPVIASSLAIILGQFAAASRELIRKWQFDASLRNTIIEFDRCHYSRHN